jgi:S-layer protein
MTVTSAQVQTLLTDILGETTSTVTDAADLASYLALSNLGTANTVTTLAAQIALDPEGGILQQVYRLYEAVLGRAPDASGLQNWVATAEAGLTAAQIHAGVSSVSQATWNTIINGFTASTEFQSKYSGIGGAALVDLLYSNILGRAPDPTGLATWTSILGNAVAGAGATPAAVITVVNGIVNSAEFIKDTAASNAAATVAAALGDTGTGPTYATTPVTPTQTITNLGTGIDNLNLTGSNNTVNGTANGTGATFNVGDQILGAAGSSGNVLSLSDLTSTPAAVAGWNPTTVAGVTVSNIQTVNLVSGEQVTANVSSSSPEGFSGITTLNVTSISGEGNAAYVDNITAGATTAVNVNDTVGTTAVTGALTVTGGSTVAITETNGTVGSAGGTITVNSGSATTSVSITQTEGAATKDAAFSITDTTSSATAAGTITSVTLNGLDTNGGTISDNSLSNLSVSNVVTGATINITANATYAATTPTTTLNLTVANDAATTVIDTRAEYTTLAITNAGVSTSTTSTPNNNSTVNFEDDSLTSITVGGTGTSIVTLTGTAGGNNFNSVASLTIGGSTGFTDVVDFGASTKLTTVTDTSSGTVTLALNAAKASFAGSTAKGKEVITITQAATGTIAGGTSGSNELIWNGVATPGASLAATGGSVTGFTTLGIGAAVIGTQAFDLSKLTGFTSVDVLGNTAAQTNLTVSNATGTTLSIDGSLSHAGPDSLVYSTADSTGASDKLSLTLGTATTTGITVDGLSLADSAGTGLGTVSIASNGTDAAANTITSLTDNALSVLNLSGKTHLVITGFGSADTATSLTINNTNTSATASSITLTDNAMTSLTIAGAGTNGTTVVLTDSEISSFTITDSAAGAVTVNPTFAGVSGLTINDSSAAAFTLGAFTDANLTTLTLNNTGSALLSTGTDTVNALNTLTFTGSGAETIGALTSSYNATLTINDSDTGAVTITALTESGLTNLAINDTSSGNLTIGTGAGNTVSTATGFFLTNSGTGTLTVGVAATPADFTTAAATSITGSGTGVISLSVTDAATAPTFDFSGSSANDTIVVARGTAATGADVYKLGNGNNTLTITGGNAANTDTVSFGSGTDTITDAASSGVHAYVNSALTGVNSATAFSTITTGASADNATLAFHGDTTAVIATGALLGSNYASVAAGIAAQLAVATHEIGYFTVGGVSTTIYVFDHGDTSSTLDASDSLVAIVGIAPTVASVASGVVTLHH